MLLLHVPTVSSDLSPWWPKKERFRLWEVGGTLASGGLWWKDSGQESRRQREGEEFLWPADLLDWKEWVQPACTGGRPGWERP